MEPRDILVAYSLKYCGDWNLMYRAITQRESVEDKYKKMVQELECKTLTLMDSNYPEHLRAISKPPLVLYYYGDIDLISNYRNNISVVGSRNFNDYGANMTKKIVSGLSQNGYVIISGMALGIDTIAHTEAIVNNGKTVAVLGTGIDYCYPSSNNKLYKELKEYHLVISEYPGDYPGEPSSFPIRNRIIAGLSKTVVITQAGYHSGTLITATLALMGNADVMCVPYPADAQSECNRLIMNGAYLVESAEDVIDQMSSF